MIKANQLVKTFGNRKVLQDINLTIDSGEIVALIGRNGAGKTTLVRILATLIKPDAGTITINGESSSENPTGLRKNLGVVLHSPMIYPNLNARENLNFYGQLYSVQNLTDRIEELLVEVDLTSRAGDLVRTYSRGMQQRLSVARAMLHNPDILLMDEVYTGLDENSSDGLDILLKHKAEEGKTILLTTHDLDRVFAVANRVDILHRGKIVFSSPVSQMEPGELVKTYKEITNGPAENPALRELK